MATNVSKEVITKRPVSGRVGKQILDVITSGMYSDPRMAIREYIQNAVDSIDISIKHRLYKYDSPYISVVLNGKDRVIIIEDNGVGVETNNVDEILGSLGCSTKSSPMQRGFRGIGRLGGLAYCDMLRFETRSSSQEQVSVVEWSGRDLRDQVSSLTSREEVVKAVKRIATVHVRRANKTDLAHYFRVSMINVHRFHSDMLMSVKSIREYLSLTAPVPYEIHNFKSAPIIEKHLISFPGYRCYNITLNGNQIFKPYVDEIEGRKGRGDRIRGVEFVKLVNGNGKLLCLGWYAHTHYLSALPQHVLMRGIRIRQGNIAVGDEYYLSDKYSESRFATWHIGEIHVCPDLKLNARRDGFEESREYEQLLEWTSVLYRHLSMLCRRSSKERSIRQSIARLEYVLNRMLNNPLFVDEEHMLVLLEIANKHLERIRRLEILAGGISNKSTRKYESKLLRLQNNPLYLTDVIDGRTLRHKNQKQVLVEICRRILDLNHSVDGIELLRKLINPYAKTN